MNFSLSEVINSSMNNFIRFYFVYTTIWLIWCCFCPTRRCVYMYHSPECVATEVIYSCLCLLVCVCVSRRSPWANPSAKSSVSLQTWSLTPHLLAYWHGEYKSTSSRLNQTFQKRAEQNEDWQTYSLLAVRRRRKNDDQDSTLFAREVGDSVVGVFGYFKRSY